MKRSTRTSTGSAISEFGPALWFLLIVIFFPVLDILGMAITYADCLFLSYSLTRQAGLEQTLVYSPKSPNGFSIDLSCSTSPTGSLNQMIMNWKSMGLGQFASTNQTPTQNATINLAEGTTNVKYIHVTLKCQCRPFLNVPFPIAVPGLNAVYSLSFNNRAVIETIPN